MNSTNEHPGEIRLSAHIKQDLFLGPELLLLLINTKKQKQKQKPKNN